MHESYRLASPDVDWFVYIEADTSLSWTNLLQFLGRMDPRKPLYLGAQNVIGPTTFAHGGSGFIISRGAAKRIEDRRRKMGARAYDDRWELSTSLSCCGDEVVARALVEVDVDLTPSCLASRARLSTRLTGQRNTGVHLPSLGTMFRPPRSTACGDSRTSG